MVTRVGLRQKAVLWLAGSDLGVFGCSGLTFTLMSTF